NREAKEVSDILNNSKVCFLPFPDGLSERRGSFLAAISCGVKVISYDGKFVTDQLRSVCELVDVNSAGDKILSILSKFSSNSHKEHVNRCKKYLKENIPQDWRAIVKSYKSVIDKK
ncbi:MAG: glycosyltransferase family 1 protein, partial [Muribaculaceae bacterium]|nr:glycosyltransferase family 1 protein [Muribaculaceae bacterium]